MPVETFVESDLARVNHTFRAYRQPVMIRICGSLEMIRLCFQGSCRARVLSLVILDSCPYSMSEKRLVVRRSSAPFPRSAAKVDSRGEKTSSGTVRLRNCAPDTRPLRVGLMFSGRRIEFENGSAFYGSFF